MKQWIKRRPNVRVIFRTKRGQFGIGSGDSGFGGITMTPIKDIISIHVDNKMNRAAGTFQIVLVYRKLKNGEPLYYEALSPLDIVDIQMSSNLSEKPSTVMVGIIDRVHKTRTMTSTGPKQRVKINGRSLGAVFLFDQVKYFRGICPEVLPEGLKGRTDVILRAASKKEFWGVPAHIIIASIVNDFMALYLSYGNENNVLDIYDFLNYTDELFILKDSAIYNEGLKIFQGPLWTYFKAAVIQPFNEMWTDSRDGKLFLRMRPTPFDLEEEIWENIDKKIFPMSWNALRTWITNEPFHVIDQSKIINESLAITHGEAISWVDIVPNAVVFDNYIKYDSFPPLIDESLFRQLGSRGLEFSVNQIPFGQNLSISTAEEQGGFIRSTFFNLRKKAYLWYKDNHRYESGTVQVAGNPDYRVGDRVLIQPDRGEGKIYYIEGIHNYYQFGSPFTSTLSLTRGATERERRIWYDDGLQYHKKVSTQVLMSTPESQFMIEISDKGTIRSNIKKTLNRIGLGGEAAETLVELTGAVESGYKNIEQIGGGSALSYWQIEPDTVYSLARDFLNYKATLMELISDTSGVPLSSLQEPDKSELAGFLKDNIKFAICMCRLVYRRVPVPLPEIEVTPMGIYWKTYYNTEKGKGTLKRFKEVWDQWMGS